MNKELTIKGFVNEMSYNLTMQELENLVVDYQDVLIDYFVNNQYNYKAKREFNEVCELVRSDRYFRTISTLVQTDDERIDPDMAYVLYTATHHIDDKELANDAYALGYRLRECEMADRLTGNKETDVAIIFSAVKTVRSYMTTPFFRTKEIENILENLPEILYNAYNGKYSISAVNEKVISTILTQTVIDLQPEEFVSACCKTCFPKDMDEKYKPYASRIQSFLYKVCGLLPADKFTKALSAACNSIDRFNNRTGRHETLVDKYLNYKLLEAVVQSKDVKVPIIMKDAYRRMTEFKDKNEQFKYLF